MMTKQLFSFIISVCAAAFLTAACQSPSLEEPETVDVPRIVSVPYSLKVNTEATKVSYEENFYQFKQGDILHVVGVDRTDIYGDLQKGNGSVWSGELHYLSSEGDPENDTKLDVTLIHADNDVTETYASAVVGSVSEGTLLQYAVEHYSWFTTQVTFGTKSATLHQQATFLDVSVTFDFDGTHSVEGGKAMVDLKTARGSMTAETDFIELSGGEDFQVHFMAVVPGGRPVNEFTLTVGDREITFKENDTVLDCNKKYTVERTIEFRPKLGDPFWSDGLYGRLKHPDPNASIVGIIVYVNQSQTDLGNALTEKTVDADNTVRFGNGLVMALKNVAADGGVKWSESTGTLCTTTVRSPKATIAINNLSGLTNTNTIISTLGEGAVSAASRAKGYDVSISSEYTTGWFLPSIGQWLYTISEGFGNADPVSTWNNNADPPENWLTKGNLENLIRVKSNGGNSNNLLVDSLNERLELLYEEFGCEYDKFGIPKKGSNSTVNYSDNYWSSSENSADKAIRMNFGSVEDGFATIKARPEVKTLTFFLNDAHYPAKIRPFLAF